MDEKIDLTDPRVERAFNEWMRRYIEHPEKFAHDWQNAEEFQKERSSGVEPSYGAVCAKYLRKLIAEAS